MTLDDFLCELESLVPPGDRYKPHKYVALMAVVDLFDRGHITENRIYHDSYYRDLFKERFRRYASSEDSCRPHTPFFHLRSCTFWHLEPKSGQEHVLTEMESVGSPSELDASVDFAYLDPEAYQWLINRETRSVVAERITRILEEREYMDTHFYVDYAPPEEVGYLLRVLSAGDPLTSEEIAQLLHSEYGIQPSDYRTEWARRLADLGIGAQIKERGLRYVLTDRGMKLQSIQAADADLARDLLHYLHFSSYNGSPSDRKYLWSYRRCCEHVWQHRRLIQNAELAATIQAEMQSEFPYLDFGARIGARFDKTAVGRVYDWLRALSPSPVSEDKKRINPRTVDRYELSVLALDDVYRARKYRYGDAVVMDDALLNQVAGVFFLDRSCCADLLRLAASITPTVKLSDTLAGPSVNLTRQFTIEDL